MTTFTADQLRSIITLSQDRYHIYRASSGRAAERTRRMLELNKTALAMLNEITTATPKYEYIDTGRRVKLGDLATSDDIGDDTIILVYGSQGNFLARGYWYTDDVLEWTQAVGTVTLAWSSPYLAVRFRIAEPENSRRVSVDNGETWVSPVEALTFVDLRAMVEYMDVETMEAVHNDAAPCSDLDFLTAYLAKAPADLVIG